MTAADVPAPGLTVDEAEVERVARAIAAAAWDRPIDLDTETSAWAGHFRRLARAALAAARPPAQADEGIPDRRRIHDPGVHKPFTDDGVTYCGHAGDGGIWEGCGHAWPCPTVVAGLTGDPS